MNSIATGIALLLFALVRLRLRMDMEAKRADDRLVVMATLEELKAERESLGEIVGVAHTAIKGMKRRDDDKDLIEKGSNIIRVCRVITRFTISACTHSD